MKKNMGTADRVIRAIIGVAIAIFIAAGQVTGTATWVLGIVAVIMLLTAATGYCPAYGPFGISTLKKG